MKRGAYLVNTARGKICDRDAVARALESGQLAGYAGDVWFPQPAPQDHPWRTMPHHGMTPHISGTSLSAQARYAAGHAGDPRVLVRRPADPRGVPDRRRRPARRRGRALLQRGRRDRRLGRGGPLQGRLMEQRLTLRDARGNRSRALARVLRGARVDDGRRARATTSVFFQSGGMVVSPLGPVAARRGQRRRGQRRLGRGHLRPQRPLAGRGRCRDRGGGSRGSDDRASRRGNVLGRLLGSFIDPDGHPWEVAHNPHWTIAADGSVTLAP